VDEEDNQVPASGSLPVGRVEIFTFDAALLSLPDMRTREQDIFHFIGLNTMPLCKLLSKYIFPDHMAEPQFSGPFGTWRG